MVTVATGPTPPRPSIGEPIGRALGAFGAYKMVETAEEQRARREAETLADVFASMFGTGRGGEVSVPERRNPFDEPVEPRVEAGTGRIAEIGRVVGTTESGRPIVQNPDGTVSTERSITVEDERLNRGAPTNVPTMFRGQQQTPQEAISRAAVAGGRDPSTGRTLNPFVSVDAAEQAAAARSDELGGESRIPSASSAPVPDDPEVGTLARAPGQFGQFFRSLPRERQVATIQALRSAGVEVPEIMEMFAPNQPDPNSELAKLRSDFQAGLITRDEFQNRRDRILAGDTTEQPALVREAIAAGLEPGTEEFQQFIMRNRGGLPGEADAPSPKEMRVRLFQRLQRGDISEEEYNRRIDQLERQPTEPPGSTDAAKAELFTQLQRGEIKEEEYTRLVSLLDGGGGDELSAKTRSLIHADRRARGETTGTPFDLLSPERAGVVRDQIANEPQRFDVRTDEFGRQFLFDTQTGERVGFIESPSPVREGRAPGESVPGQLTAGRGELGLMGRLQQFGNVLFPQFGAQMTEPQRTALESNLNSLRERLTAALRENRRLLKVQVEELRNLIPNPDSFLESGPNAIAKLLTLKGRLEDERANAIAIADSQESVPDERKDASKLANDLNVILADLQVPPEIFDNADPQSTFEFASALTPRGARELEPEVVQRMLPRMSEEQFLELNPQIQEILREKFFNGERG